jgi:hypothetical protein
MPKIIGYHRNQLWFLARLKNQQMICASQRAELREVGVGTKGFLVIIKEVKLMYTGMDHDSIKLKPAHEGAIVGRFCLYVGAKQVLHEFSMRSNMRYTEAL